MKYIKTYEGILLSYKPKYYVAKADFDDFFILFKTNSSYANKIYVKNILPEKSQEYYFYVDEIAVDTYQDDKFDVWTFLYSSDNFEDAKNKYETYVSANKYNL
jgi:hypothetical protein